jgi:hypothetical protein
VLYRQTPADAAAAAAAAVQAPANQVSHGTLQPPSNAQPPSQRPGGTSNPTMLKQQEEEVSTAEEGKVEGDGEA